MKRTEGKDDVIGNIDFLIINTILQLPGVLKMCSLAGYLTKDKIIKF